MGCNKLYSHFQLPSKLNQDWPMWPIWWGGSNVRLLILSYKEHWSFCLAPLDHLFWGKPAYMPFAGHSEQPCEEAQWKWALRCLPATWINHVWSESSKAWQAFVRLQFWMAFDCNLMSDGARNAQLNSCLISDPQKMWDDTSLMWC